MLGPKAGEQAGGKTADNETARKWGEAAAVRRYIQETTDVISYLREPLKTTPADAALMPSGAVAMLESLTIFRDVMQHNPAWPEIVIPEPELIAAARGHKPSKKLLLALQEWLAAMMQPVHREYWCKRAFEKHVPGFEREYWMSIDRAQSAMLLLFDEDLSESARNMMDRLNETPMNLNLLEYVRDLQVRDFF